MIGDKKKHSIITYAVAFILPIEIDNKDSTHPHPSPTSTSTQIQLIHKNHKLTSKSSFNI